VDPFGTNVPARSMLSVLALGTLFCAGGFILKVLRGQLASYSIIDVKKPCSGNSKSFTSFIII
jgi:hypothetical protein